MGLDAFVCEEGRLPDPLPSALEYWTAIKGDRQLPRRSDFDPVDIPRLLPHIILTEVLRTEHDRGFRDFRFRVIGSYIDQRLSDRYTGRCLSEIEGKGPGSGIWSAYCAVKTNRTPTVRSFEYIGPMENLKRTCELYLPLSNNGERVDFIVVALVFA